MTRSVKLHDLWSSHQSVCGLWRPALVCCEIYQSHFHFHVPVKPFVRLHWTKPPIDHQPAILACGVYDFYPKPIKVSWLRNGQEVTSNTTTTEELPDADWLYQTHSYLEYTPR